jgi:hypothetical protein
MSEIDEFEKNLISGGTGNFWRPENEGDHIFGTLIRTAETKSGEVFVIKTEEGTEKMLPSHASLSNQFKRNGIGIGDKVLIKFMGWSTRKYFGKNIRLYQIAAKHPDGTFVKQAPMEEEQEAESEPQAPSAPAPSPASPPATPEPPPTKKTRKSKASVEQAPKEEAQPAAKKDETATKDEEVKHFVGQLFKFFDTMPIEDLHKYVNETRNFGLPVDVVITMCDLTVFEKDGKKLVTKKKS